MMLALQCRQIGIAGAAPLGFAMRRPRKTARWASSGQKRLFHRPATHPIFAIPPSSAFRDYCSVGILAWKPMATIAYTPRGDRSTVGPIAWQRIRQMERLTNDQHGDTVVFGKTTANRMRPDRASCARLRHPAGHAPMIRSRAHWVRCGSFTALLLVLVAASIGCVQRRMTIRSNPPGALVYVDDYEIGVTPVSHTFTYYGQRKIRLVKDGYETLTVMQNIRPPWYQYPVVDFFAENLWPGEIRDERDLNFNLSPQVMVPPDQLLGRAEELRRGVHASAGSAPPPVRIGPPSGAPSGPEVVAPGQPIYGGRQMMPLGPQ